LAPKHKLFTVEHGDAKRKEYRAAFMHYKGEENQKERRMEQRYLKLQQEQLAQQHEDR
jgi:hypothetical protein